ncbi:major facilitator superfamily domain-containing protein [Xylariaceae sp. FL1272]|nr:major facilitator superfamily domain-containing protein [Xylariaceae sp. FL1272]
MEDTAKPSIAYSFLESTALIAMLIRQPFSSVLVVKVPHRILMPSLLLAARFFLGLFEEVCLPLFSAITSQWYRRYGTNSAATIVASALSYGLRQIPKEALRAIFLFVGLVAIVSVLFVYWKLNNDIPSAHFLTSRGKKQAIKRLRANQTGLGLTKFEFSHVVEICLEPKNYLWMGMTLLVNVGAAVTNAFGPLISNNLGYNEYLNSLLNIPFSALQLIANPKPIAQDILTIPVVIGLVLLYILNRSSSQQGPLLPGYYFLPFLFSANPLIVSWIVGNKGGTTKRSVIMSLYSGSSAAGNIRNGLRSTLAIFVTLIAIVALQAGNLFVLNRLNRKSRVRSGKKADIRDHSMNDRYVAADIKNANATGRVVRLRKDTDLTDGKDDEFVYIY